MLRLLQVEEIERLLLELPGLVALQEAGSGEFPARTGAWLGSLEEVLSANRLFQAGLVASVRSNLALTGQGQVPPGLVFRGRATRSRVVTAAASEALQRAAEIAAGILAENRPRLMEAERVAQQIVAAIRSHGIPPRPEGMHNDAYLRSLRRALAQNPDLEAVVVHLEGLVGPQDALVLLDRSISATEPVPVAPSQTPRRRAALRGDRGLLAGGKRS